MEGVSGAVVEFIMSTTACKIKQEKKNEGPNETKAS